MSEHDQKPRYESPTIVPLGELAKGSGTSDCVAGTTAYVGLHARNRGITGLHGRWRGNILLHCRNCLHRLTIAHSTAAMKASLRVAEE